MGLACPVCRTAVATGEKSCGTCRADLSLLSALHMDAHSLLEKADAANRRTTRRRLCKPISTCSTSTRRTPRRGRRGASPAGLATSADGDKPAGVHDCGGADRGRRLRGRLLAGPVAINDGNCGFVLSEVRESLLFHSLRFDPTTR